MHQKIQRSTIKYSIMKTILITLLLGISANLFAQDATSELAPKKNSKFTFGWVYSPEVSYRILSEGDQADENTALFIDARNEQEQAKFGQSFSFFLGYQIASRFRLEGGVGFTDYGEAVKPYDLVNAIEPEVIGTVKRANHIFVTTFPISLQFEFGKNKIRGFVSASVVPSILTSYSTNSKIEFTNGDISTGTFFSASAQDDYSKFILGANVSGGIDYKYSEKASVRIAPVFRMTTNTVYPDAPIRGHYFNVGIEFGTIYNL